jgi:hypothetical protein
MSEHPCQAVVEKRHNGIGGRWSGDVVCGKTDTEKPMTFRGTDWCCDDHWKLVLAQGGVR